MTKQSTGAAPDSAEGGPVGDDFDAYLAPTYYMNFHHPSVRAYAEATVDGIDDPVERAVRLYYAVRDDIRYDPYAMDLRPEAFRASYCLDTGRGFCIQKGVLLAATLRACSIPARLGFADVINHLATERFLDLIETNLFIYHGFVEMHVGGKWVKATPAFNMGLCEKFHVLPLEFDGRTDSLFHPFDAKGQRHMEYVDQRGTFADLPFRDIERDFLALYPKYFAQDGDDHHGASGDFEAEAEAENRPAD